MIEINWYYILAICAISCGSIPKGWDEGGFSASVGLDSFVNDYNLIEDNWKGREDELATREGNIKSFAVMGAALGAGGALFLNDRFGRIWTWRCAVVWWAVGMFMQIFSSGIYGLILFARIWLGLGAGVLTVTSPLYLSEIAPAKTRGMVVTVNMVFLLFWLMVGFWVNYGVNKNLESSPQQYRIVQAVPLIPVGLGFIGSWFLSDTPRWLASKDRTDEAIAVLSRLRKTDKSSDAVHEEYDDIAENVHRRIETLKEVSTWTVVKEVVTNKKYRERFLLGAAVQTVAQWTGGNGITFYIPTIFEYAGIADKNQSLISSGAYGAVKFVFTAVFAWGLVDYFGRRVCTQTGLFLQCATHIYMAIYMSLWRDGSNKSASDAAIASVFVYAFAWSIGLCNTQALYGTEIYPTRIRSVCYAATMFLHWWFQFAVVRVTPNMFVGLGVSGAYIFWASVCGVGFILLGIWAPETKGVPLERMDELFAGPWYMGWKAKVDLTAEPHVESGSGPKEAGSLEKQPRMSEEAAQAAQQA